MFASRPNRRPTGDEAIVRATMESTAFVDYKHDSLCYKLTWSFAHANRLPGKIRRRSAAVGGGQMVENTLDWAALWPRADSFRYVTVMTRGQKRVQSN